MQIYCNQCSQLKRKSDFLDWESGKIKNRRCDKCNNHENFNAIIDHESECRKIKNSGKKEMFIDTEKRKTRQSISDKLNSLKDSQDD